MTLQKQLQEEKYLEENQEELQDGQSPISSKSCFLSFLLVFSSLFNLVVVPNDEFYKYSSLQEEMKSSHQAKNEKTEDGS